MFGLRVATSETGAAWNEFFADLVARGLTGVRLVTADAHPGLKDVIAANLSGAAWQRCRTHYASNLMVIMPKSMWPAVKAMLHGVYDQTDAAPVNAQFDRLIDYVAEHLDEWAEGRRYLGLEVLHRCRLTPVDDTRNEVTADPETTLELVVSCWPATQRMRHIADNHAILERAPDRRSGTRSEQPHGWTSCIFRHVRRK